VRSPVDAEKTAPQFAGTLENELDDSRLIARDADPFGGVASGQGNVAGLRPLTCLLVDFENVQPSADDVALLRGEDYRLWVFRGPHQTKYDAALAEAWQPLGKHVRFVQGCRPGKNALDFYLAFFLGRLCEEFATAGQAVRFVVISNDRGLLPLFEYMAVAAGVEGGIAPTIAMALDVARKQTASVPDRNTPHSCELAAIQTSRAIQVARTTPATPVRAAPSKPAPTAAKSATEPKKTAARADPYRLVLESLRKHSKNRPAKLQTLVNHIPSAAGASITKGEAEQIVQRLAREGHLVISGNKLEYRLGTSK